MPNVILVGDVDRTQAYVFESYRLPEIRGASRMLDDAGFEAGELIKQRGELVFQGGGSLLAIVEQSNAEHLAREIENLYLNKTLTATISVDWRSLPENLLQSELLGAPAAFGSLMDWAAVWLRRKKDSRDVAPWVETHAHTERCRSCRIRPATAESLAEYPDWPLCSICKSKRNYKGRDLWFGEFQDFLEKNPPLGKRYYNNHAPFPRFKVDDLTARWTPQDLDEIGQCCQTRPGYVGMIYLDGDNMGQVFSNVTTRADARALSLAIYEASRQAVFSALATLHPFKVSPSPARKISGEWPQGGESILIHPFEIITIGGDDLLLIVPADQAILISTQISQDFPGLLTRELQKTASPALRSQMEQNKPSLSGGVVLASDHNPIQALWNRARELKSSAKKARLGQKSAEGYLDFCILTGTEVPDRSLKAERERYPYTIQIPGKPQPVSLLRRPYPASKLGQAWLQLLTLRRDDFAHGQMVQLAQELLNGQALSRQYYLYQRERIRGVQQLDKVVEILQGPVIEATYPWFEYQKSTTQPFSAVTAVWDIAELYPFVP